MGIGATNRRLSDGHESTYIAWSQTGEVEAQQQREKPENPSARGRLEPNGCAANLHEMANHELRLDRCDQQYRGGDRRVDLMRGTAIEGDQR